MKINNLAKNKKQMLIILAIFVFFLSAWVVNGVLLKRVLKNKEIEQVKTEQAPLPPKFSRISFFHTAKPICTLAIPENWEGKYRLQDNGGVAHFLYIQDVANPEIFYIKKYEKGDYANKESEKKIFENKNVVYVIGLSTQGVNEPVNKDDFEKMTKDLDVVLKNFKCF